MMTSIKLMKYFEILESLGRSNDSLMSTKKVLFSYTKVAFMIDLLPIMECLVLSILNPYRHSIQEQIEEFSYVDK